MSNISEVIRHFPGDLQDPMIQFWEVVKDELGVKREDFTELKNIVEELAESQKRTECRVEELVGSQKELAESQKELAESQKELTKSQNRTEEALQRLSVNIDFKLGGLGSRWGINSERAFRSGLREVLSDCGYTVFNFIETDTEGMIFSETTRVEIDVIIEGDKTIIVEIKSSVSKGDVYIFMKKAAFYTHISGRKVDRLLMITPYIDDCARVDADKHQIVICDSISDLGPMVRKS